MNVESTIFSSTDGLIRVTTPYSITVLLVIVTDVRVKVPFLLFGAVVRVDSIKKHAPFLAYPFLHSTDVNVTA